MGDNMKILLVSNMYPSQKYPSYGVFVENFVRGFEAEGAVIKKILLFKEKNKIIRFIKYIVFYIKIIFLGIFANYDFIYVHYISHSAIPLLLLKKLKKFNLFINVHGSDVVPNKKTGVYFNKYVRKILKEAKKIIVPSKYFMEIMIEKYNICNENIIISASGGIDKEVFYPIYNNLELRKEYNISQNTTLIGYVGRLDPGKEWKIFLKSIEILKEKYNFSDIKAVIAGDGSEKLIFQKCVKDFNLNHNVIYLGALEQKKLNILYNVIDVFCFPTKGESLGLVALEAMATGTPVIGSNNSALPEYIENGTTGYLASNDEYDFSEKINMILGELKIKNTYKYNCLLKSSYYNKEEVIKSLYKEIKEIVNN